jgi:predicted phage terminase large subunit-like protein
VKLAAFISQLVEPSFVFKPFHAEWMRFVSASPQKKLLLAPRTHGKSTITNLCNVINKILHDRDIRILIASETDLQAEGFISHLKQVMESPVFMAVFGDLRGDNWTKTHGLTVKGRTKILKEPTVMARSVGSALPSFHFDMIVLDDVIDDDDVHTEGQRKAIHDWYYQTLEPTLTSEGEILVIGTRWHFFDLYGALMQAGGFLVKQYKAIISPPAPEGQKLWDTWVELANSLDAEDQKAADVFRDEHRAEMDAGVKVLLPEVWPYDKLMLKKARSGSSIFEKQYQNNPSLGEGRQILKPTDFRYYAPDDLPDQFLCVVSGYDLAISEKEQADYTAVVTVGVTDEGKIYVLKAYRGHLGFASQLELIQNTFAAWHEDLVVIESVQYQQALANEVKRWTSIPVKKYSPSVDKVTRALGVQPQIEGHRVLFRGGRKADSGTRMLTQELAEFPFGEHDDLVDAFTSAVSQAVELAARMRKRKGTSKTGLYI